MSPKSSFKAPPISDATSPTASKGKIVIATEKRSKSKLPEIPKRRATRFDSLKKKTKENRILPESMVSPMKKSKKPLQDIDILQSTNKKKVFAIKPNMINFYEKPQYNDQL